MLQLFFVACQEVRFEWGKFEFPLLLTHLAKVILIYDLAGFSTQLVWVAKTSSGHFPPSFLISSPNLV